MYEKLSAIRAKNEEFVLIPQASDFLTMNVVSILSHMMVRIKIPNHLDVIKINCLKI